MKYLKYFLAAAVLSALIQGKLEAQGKQTVIIDTPTAFTISRGTYKISLLEYDNGGMEFKTFLGLHDFIYLGVSFDVQNAIGKDKPHYNVPGVIARLKFTDGWDSFPIAMAAGYDSFYTGSEGREEDMTLSEEDDLNRVIYGPYFVFTGSIYLFESEQYLSIGLRTPTQPEYKPDNTSYFTSIDIPLGELFRFQFEMERVFWNFRTPGDWLYNVGIKYNYLDMIGFEIAVIMEHEEKPNRVIRIEYHNEF
ncbi:MAG TPA: hypothetical protein PK514_13240 [Spirochaetota bacterium]|nr:hypothetical protein [Spirochaetota bacterium]